MNQVLWKLPVPATSLTRGPYFSADGRQCELAYYLETEDGDRKETVLFEGVEAYKCTYYTSLSVEMIRVAYAKIVRIDPSPWLLEVRRRFLENTQGMRKVANSEELQHLMICFDDGPCYEVICVAFRTP